MPDIQPTTLAMRDWRLADGEDEASLPEHARGAFSATLSAGPYDNLVIDLVSPNGDKASLRLEVDDGQWKILVSCPDPEEAGSERAETDLLAFITRKGVLAVGNASGNPGALFDGDRVRVLPVAETDLPMDRLRAPYR